MSQLINLNVEVMLMFISSRYRVNHPTMAFSSKKVAMFRCLPRGGMTSLDSIDDDKLVAGRSTWCEQKILVFTQDIRTRGEKLESAG
jgi:hypothetical protein